MAIATELNINTTATAEDMFNAIFGSGIELVANSATFSGDAAASGTYTGALSTLPGIVPSDRGVILSTGNAADFTNGTGTADTNISVNTGVDLVNGIDADAQLNAVSGMSTFDGSILAADFIPTGDMLTMQFVFSSEEYPEYVNGGVNDSFGVWINGQFVEATITVAGNISIDTVNASVNKNLYRDNTADQFNTEMDGFTYVLSFKAPVNAGQVNSIKIGIADGGDAIYDSNLLIMGDSIQTYALAMDDAIQLTPNSSRTFDILANDRDFTDGGLSITHIQGVAVVAGQTVTLSTGEQVRLNADGTVTVFSDGDLGSNALNYTIADSQGNTDVGFIIIETVATVGVDGIVQGTAGADVIDAAYLGDPDGDRIDNNDGQGVSGTVGDADYIMAGAGNDSIVAGAANDIIYAGTGNDNAFGGDGDDWASLGEGNDSFGTFNADSAGNDTIYGDAGSDYLIGGGQNDVLFGGLSNDTLSGGVGSDTLDGGDGADHFAITDDHQGDTILGGEGGNDNDVLVFGNSVSANGVNLSAAGAEAGVYNFAGSSSGTTGTYSEIESFVGTVYDDNLNLAADGTGVTAYGLGGNDTILGGGGQDLIFGNEGKDAVSGGAGNDTVYGGDGNDTLSAGDTGDDLQYGGLGDDVFSGDAGNDTIYGDDGNDAIEGHDGADIVYGGTGDDYITGFGVTGLNTPANRTLNPTVGSDDGLADLLEGGDGNDTILGGGGADTLTGSSGNDALVGGAGADSLTGGADSDTIYGGAGDAVIGGETVTTGTENDTLVLNYAEVESISYGGGNNEAGTVTFTAASGGGTLNFSEIENIVYAGPVDGAASGELMGAGYTDLNGDQVDGLDGNDDTIFGNAGNDTINAGAGNDQVYGGDSNDVLRANSGDDTLSGDAGNDDLQSGSGNDLMSGGDGADLIHSFENSGADTVVGGEGNDPGFGDILNFDTNTTAVNLTFSGNEAGTATAGATTVAFSEIETIFSDNGNDTINAAATTSTVNVLSGGGNDFVTGGAGNDYLAAQEGNDEVFAGQGDDNVYGDIGADQIYGGDGNDQLYGGVDNDYLQGDAGNDLVDAGAGDDFLRGDAGNDIVYGGTGNDSVYGGAGNDTVYGGDGNDEVYGGYGDDTVYAGAGNDTVTGSGETDVVYGDDGDDLIQGSYGNDTLYGGIGADTMLGEEDADTFYAGVGDFVDGYETVTAGTDNDTLRVTNVDHIDWDLLNPENGVVYYSGGGSVQFFNIERVFADGVQVYPPNFIVEGTGGDDVIDAVYAGDPEGDMIDAADNLAGNDEDLVYAGNGNDTVLSGSGNDTVFAGAGNDSVEGGLGNDTINGEQGDDTLFGGAGDDSLTGWSGANLMYGGTGNDQIIGGDNDDMLYGDAGNDSLGGGTGDDALYGGDNADIVLGEEGNDIIDGGAGADTLYGGIGEDTLEAGSGNDTLAGGEDADKLRGGGGDDTFVIENAFGAGDNVLGGEDAGGTDIDVLDASANTEGLLVAFNGDEAGFFSSMDGSGSGAFAEIEQFVLTSGRDSVEGGNTTGGINIDLGAGNDAIHAGSGVDTIMAGLGEDMVQGGQGNDLIDLGAADGAQDTLAMVAGDGRDTITGFEAPIDNGDGTFTGRDLLEVSSVLDAVGNPVNVDDVTVSDDGNGNAVLTFPNGESMTLVGVSVAAVSSPAALVAMGIPAVTLDYIVEGTSGGDYIDLAYTGDPEGDMIDASDSVNNTNDDLVTAGAGDDTVFSHDGNDTVYGEDGNDLLQTGLGDDVLYGGVGNDQFFTENGSDTVYGGDGNDTAYASLDGDLVYGGAGDDSLIGGGYAVGPGDTLYGETGNDTLSGGGGNDLLYGGADNDLFQLVGPIDNDTISGGETGTDTDVVDLSTQAVGVTVGFTGNEAGSITGAGSEQTAFSEIEAFNLTAQNDLFEASGTTNGTTAYAGNGADTLQGGSGNDTLFADAGNDGIFGGAGDDSISAGTGNDTVAAGEGNDIAYGGQGDDNLSLWTGNNLGHGDDGNDWISAEAGNDTLYGGTGVDTIFGGAGNDLIYGGDGNDTINAGDGVDTVYGDADADVFVVQNPMGTNYIYGGEAGIDTDTVDLLNHSGAVSILYAGTEAGVINDGATGSTTFSQIEALVLTTDNDLVDASADTAGITIRDYGGDDTIIGGSGNDSILAGDGNDTLLGGAGDDTISGGNGSDWFSSGAGNDQMYGGADSDFLSVNDGEGNDTFIGGESAFDADQIIFENLTNPVTVILTSDEAGTAVSAGAVTAFSQIESFVLTNGDDLIDASASTSPLMVIAAAGNDTIIGSQGQDNLSGADGNDSIDGGLGDDLISGAAGADTFVGGAGNDVMMLGFEDGEVDVVRLSDGEGQDFVIEFETPIDNGDGTFTGRDQLDVAGLTDAGGYPVDVNDVVVSADVDGNAVLTFPNGESITLVGVPVSEASTIDQLAAMGIPYAPDLVVDGTAGNDVMGAGFVDIHGDQIDGSDGNNDVIMGYDGNDAINAGFGDDTISGDAGDDTVSGQEGNDSVYGDAGADSLNGGVGEDALFGGVGNDQIDGGLGNDIITGGDGADSLYGADDRDSFFGGIGDFVDGGEAGDDYDTLNLTAYGHPATNIIYDTINPENGMVEFLDADGNVVGTMSFSNIENVVACFTPGTLVLTDLGEIAVEDLVPGDRVLTRDNGYQTIRWTGRRDLSRAELIVEPRFNPVFIARGALGAGLPERDMMVSPQHRMLLSGARAEMLFGEHEVFAAAKHLIGMAGVEQRVSKSVSYIHILFDQHEIVRADGAWSESFQPGDQTLEGMGEDQRAEIMALFPELLDGAGYSSARLTLKAREARVLIGA